MAANIEITPNENVHAVTRNSDSSSTSSLQSHDLEMSDDREPVLELAGRQTAANILTENSILAISFNNHSSYDQRKKKKFKVGLLSFARYNFICLLPIIICVVIFVATQVILSMKIIDPSGGAGFAARFFNWGCLLGFVGGSIVWICLALALHTDISNECHSVNCCSNAIRQKSSETLYAFLKETIFTDLAIKRFLTQSESSSHNNFKKSIGNILESTSFERIINEHLDLLLDSTEGSLLVTLGLDRSTLINYVTLKCQEFMLDLTPHILQSAKENYSSKETIIKNMINQLVSEHWLNLESKNTNQLEKQLLQAYSQSIILLTTLLMTAFGCLLGLLHGSHL